MSDEPTRLYRFLLGLAVAVFVFVVVSTLVPTKRGIYGVAPLGPESVVLRTRRKGDPASYWVQHVRSDGTVIGNDEQTAFETDVSLGFTPVVATDDAVFLVGDHGYFTDAGPARGRRDPR